MTERIRLSAAEEALIPILGVRWNDMPDEATATRTARRIEYATRRWANPCEAFAYEEDGQWMLKVRNW